MRKLAYWALLGLASWATVAGAGAGAAMLFGFASPPSMAPVAFAVMVVSLVSAVRVWGPR